MSVTIGNRAIQGVVKGAKTNAVISYQGADNTTTDAQYALVSAGKAGTDGVLNGVLLTAGREITAGNVDSAGNISGPSYAGPFGTWSAPSNIGPAAFTKSLGVPIAGTTNTILTSTAITALPVTGNKVDKSRTLKLTGNANSSSVITATAVDTAGAPISEDFTLNGTSAVAGLKAFGPGMAITFTLKTGHTGDTFACGVTEALGLPVRIDNPGGLLSTIFGGTKEGTAATLTYDASVLCLNTVDLNSALDGSKEVVVNGIQSDAVLPFTSAMNR